MAGRTGGIVAKGEVVTIVQCQPSKHSLQLAAGVGVGVSAAMCLCLCRLWFRRSLGNLEGNGCLSWSW